MKVVHVVGALTRGGTQTWLLSLSRQMLNNRDITFEIITQDHAPASGYEQAFRDLGVQIVCIPRDWRWPYRVYRHLREEHRPDVIHSHRDWFSGVVLSIAMAARVPKRIAHNHSDFTINESLAHRAIRATMRSVLRIVATERIAVSAQAQKALFDSRGNDSIVIYCGIDVERFAYNHASRQRIRKEFGIAESTPVVIHVGDFAPVKNHRLILDVFSCMLRDHVDSAHLILVGEGPLRQEIEAYADHLGIGDSVIFAGVRDDVPALLSAADAFLFPSFSEGLGLAAVEAQASRLPTLVSSTLPDEVVIDVEVVTILGLDAPAEMWAVALSRSIATDHDRAAVSPGLARFDIRTCADAIGKVYGSGVYGKKQPRTLMRKNNNDC